MKIVFTFHLGAFNTRSQMGLPILRSHIAGLAGVTEARVWNDVQTLTDEQLTSLSLGLLPVAKDGELMLEVKAETHESAKEVEFAIGEWTRKNELGSDGDGELVLDIFAECISSLDISDSVGAGLEPHETDAASGGWLKRKHVGASPFSF